jgi:hypothetical protein
MARLPLLMLLTTKTPQKTIRQLNGLPHLHQQMKTPPGPCPQMRRPPHRHPLPGPLLRLALTLPLALQLLLRLALTLPFALLPVPLPVRRHCPPGGPCPLPPHGRSVGRVFLARADPQRLSGRGT